MGQRQTERRIPHQLPARCGRRHEPGRFGRVGEDLQRRAAPFHRVAVQQCIARPAPDHAGEFPADVLGIRKAVIQPPHTKNRHDMGAVPDKEHAPISVIIQCERIGRIDAPPFQFPIAIIPKIGEHSRDGRPDITLVNRGGLVFAVAQLIVDAPNILGLLMHQNGSTAPTIRVKQCTPDCRVVMVHLHIRNHITPLEILTLQTQPPHLPHGTARAIRGQHPFRRELIAAERITHREFHTVFGVLDASDFTLPARFNQRLTANRIPQILLDILLLQIIHRAVFLARAVRHHEFKDLLPAIETAPRGPRE